MKTLPLWLRGAALTVLALASLSARADDIDIYSGTASGVAPNLLLILDNAAANDASVSFNCPSSVPAPDSKTAGTNFGFARCGLHQAIAAIGSSPTLNGNINLGLMYFPPGDTNGGQFVVPATPSPPTGLLPMDSAGIKTMTTRVSQLSLADKADKSSNNQVSQAMQEAWAFYQGKTGLSGTTYRNPGPAAEACAKNFVLYITLAKNNNKPQDGGGRAAGAFPASYKPPSVTLPAWPSPVSPFGIADGKYARDPSPKWANFMYTGGAPALSPAYPGITTYTIILSDGSNPDYEQLMVSMANQGGGKYFVVDLTDPNALNELVKDIGLVFNEVQAVNSVFSSPTLPVTANAQGTYLNQVYMGMFRPDANGYPRWMGNVKQYQVVLSNGTPVLGDATGAPALSSAGTGFITPTATSFWTSKNTATSPDAAPPTGTGGFWVNKPQGISGAIDSADGEVVEKGGVAQQIRLANLKNNYATNPSAPRNVYTCLGSSCKNNAALSTMPFSTSNSSNLTATELGISSSSGIDPNNLINWVRGHDNIIGDERGPGGGITIRPSVHGDVLHSRPAVINYGGSKGVVVFYGANDGMFRAINGNQSMGIGSIPAGGELWSFVPQEFYPGLQQLYQNAPLLTLGAAQTTPPSASTSGKRYFFDGETGVYQQKDSSGNTTAAYIFLSARRGGRLIYALDVTDPTNPKFLWKHTNADSGFLELGQTWSQPKVAMVKGNTNPVLIFGAGYDPNEDFEPPTSADTMGRGVFILDAVTGNLLWQAVSPSATCAGGTVPCVQPAGMDYAIPADVTLVDRDRDGKIDGLYAADLGGNIWRVDLEPTGTGAVNTWQATLLAALGGAGTPKRKFFFPPDVVTTNYVDSAGHGLALVAAVTGDREHPLITQQANKVVNRFYLIKDTNLAKSATGWTPVKDDSSSILNAAPTAPAQLFDATSTQYDNSLSGYYVTLQNPGEKGVNAPLTVAGTVYFSTNQPPQPGSSTSCKANLGTARPYTVDVFRGAPPTPKPFDGGGLAPSPVFAVVDVLVNGKTKQMPVLFGGGIGDGADSRSGAGLGDPFKQIPMKKKRTYWYRNSDQ